MKNYQQPHKQKQQNTRICVEMEGTAATPTPMRKQNGSEKTNQLGSNMRAFRGVNTWWHPKIVMFRLKEITNDTKSQQENNDIPSHGGKKNSIIINVYVPLLQMGTPGTTTAPQSPTLLRALLSTSFLKIPLPRAGDGARTLQDRKIVKSWPYQQCQGWMIMVNTGWWW